ncbi:putative transmembrane protein [Senna tora]|uniref:Putative transmembrane protein n=1 Tax=Senna tora TaxID=362788 RepID=A0A834XHX9_9FABA|nr:putative transmembrane protein [Senna tora]
MLMGHADSLSDLRSSPDQILAEPELCDDEVEDCAEQIVYSASFDELASKFIQYDTVIWLSISLLLVLAWGVGIIMLIYLPIRRYVLQKDLSSRQLYVTPTKIVYKVSRPSFIPFWGIVTIEKQVSLSLVIDIIIEQGWLQSIYGIHTFRIESIAHGKAAPVDELQVQGVSNPDLLRKVIITEASKISQDANKIWKPTAQSIDVENMVRMGLLTDKSVVLRSPSKSWKMAGSPYHASPERRVLNKLEEVNKSVKRLELLFEKSQAPHDNT